MAVKRCYSSIFLVGTTKQTLSAEEGTDLPHNVSKRISLVKVYGTKISVKPPLLKHEDLIDLLNNDSEGSDPEDAPKEPLDPHNAYDLEKAVRYHDKDWPPPHIKPSAPPLRKRKTGET